MTRDQKIARARELRDEQGMTYEEIGAVLGITIGAVWKWLNPERARDIRHRDNAKRRAAKRAWANEHDRQPCGVCGELMGVGAHRHGHRRCGACARAETSAAREATRNEVQRLWNAGAKRKDIAEALGLTPSTVSTVVCTMRAEGRDLALRRPDAQALMAERWAA